MRIRSFQAVCLIVALSTALTTSAAPVSVAQAGSVEQSVHDSASGVLARKSPEPAVACRSEPRGPFAPVQNQGGGGLLGAGLGLASLAVLTANASLLSSSGDLFRPACESRSVAATRSKGMSFAAPNPAPTRTVTE